MFKWVPYPFLRLTPAFIAGILLGIYFDLQVKWWYLAIVLSAYFLIAFLTPRKQQYQVSILLGMLGITCLVLGGFIRTHQHSAINHQEHITHDTARIAYYTARVIEPTSEKKRSYQTTIVVEKVLFAGETQWKNRKGKVLLYQSKRIVRMLFNGSMGIKLS